MRWARPSTIAVLPTPGSPMRTGLFLVRRLEDLDDPPDLLVPADDRVELAGARLGGEVAAVLLERLVRALRVREVTRWPPRTLWSALRIASRPAPWRSSSACASPPASATPRSRCSVRDVVVAEAAGLVLRPARGRAWRAGRGTASRPGSGRAGRGCAASSPRNAGRSTPSRRSVSAGMPSSGSTSAASRCSASSTGLCSRSARLLGGDDRLLRLLGESIELHLVRSRCRGSVVQVSPGGRAGRRGRGTRFGGGLASSSRSVGRTTRTFT